MEKNSYLAEAECLRLNGGEWEKAAVSLAKECLLCISVNGKRLPEIACSPADMEELITGHLITEGIVRGAGEIVSLRMDEIAMPEKLLADVCVKESPALRTETEPVFWDAEMIRRLSDYVIRDADRHRGSHSTHSCTLMRNGEIICSREDIGRHNAIDRAIGWAAKNGICAGECIAFFSGRISGDAVRKAAAAGISVFCGKALPTQQAVKLAREKGVVLLHCSENRGLLMF